MASPRDLDPKFRDATVPADKRDDVDGTESEVTVVNTTPEVTQTQVPVVSKIVEVNPNREDETFIVAKDAKGETHRMPSSEYAQWERDNEKETRQW